MKAIIYGANGQDAYYLQNICRENRVEPVLISRSDGPWRKSDVANFEMVEEHVQQLKPKYIFHLAANSTTKHDAILDNHKTIVDGTLNILESVLRHSPSTKVFLTGSALQFVNNGDGISETNQFDPSSAYALARINSVYLGRYYRSKNIPVYIGYLFHHESPLRKPGHVAKLISAAAARIASGHSEILELGDIQVQKEWTFAGDVMQAVWDLVNQDQVIEATIGSGVPYSIESWLECCFSFIGKDWRDWVHLRPGFVAEYSRVYSNPSTIRSLGWTPKITIDQLAKMMVQADIASIKS